MTTYLNGDPSYFLSSNTTFYQTITTTNTADTITYYGPAPTYSLRDDFVVAVGDIYKHTKLRVHVYILEVDYTTNSYKALKLNPITGESYGKVIMVPLEVLAIPDEAWATATPKVRVAVKFKKGQTNDAEDHHQKDPQAPSTI